MTKDFFLLDFVFFLMVTITNRAEMDQIPDTVKTVGKKHKILKESYMKILVNSAHSSCLHLAE